MPQVLHQRPRSAGTYAAIALFLAVYLGVLGLVFAPKDMVAAQSPSAFISTD